MDVPPAIELAWDRAAGADTCIDGTELSERVQATIGRPVRVARGDAKPGGGEPLGSERSTETPSSGGIEVLEGSVAPLPGAGWIAVVDVRGAKAAGLRREVTLDAPDCRALDEAIVLVVALMADAPLPRPPALVVPRRRTPVTLAMGPEVAVAIGLMPGVATGIGLSADLAIPGYWHVAAWAHAWPFDQALDGTSGARLAAWTFGVGPCAGAAVGERASVFGCAGVTGGVIYAGGVGVDAPQNRSIATFEVEARVGARVRLAGPLLVRLEVGLAVPTIRASYVFSDPTSGGSRDREVFRTAAVIPLARLGVEFQGP